MRFSLYFLFSGLLLAPWLMAATKVTEPSAKVRKELRLAPFYKKHVDVGGFSIVSSEKVSNYALLEAAYLINQMLEGREDLLQAMAKNKVRFSVMAHNEYTTQIPEHSDLQPRLYWNRRARGLGATPERPSVSCGEENLLLYPNDPYSTENILIHEFAHAVHKMGLSETDPSFDERLESTYDLAVKEGLWKGKYASRNHYEYFAEGVQSWFDTNRENDFEHNHVDTREELKVYDPRLSKLVKEVFGERPWRYKLPADRRPVPAHLKGYDPKKAPAFGWPARSVAWYGRFKAGKETLAPDHALELELLSPESENWRSPRTPHETQIFISNASSRAIALEWIDFDGIPKAYGVELRPTDHTQQHTYAGHVWRLIDDKTKKPLHYFVVPKKPGKLIYKAR